MTNFLNGVSMNSNNFPFKFDFLAELLNEQAIFHLLNLVEMTLYSFRMYSQQLLLWKYIDFYYKSVLNVLLESLKIITAKKITNLQSIDPIIKTFFSIFSLIFDDCIQEGMEKKKGEFYEGGKKQLLKSFEKFTISFDKIQLQNE